MADDSTTDAQKLAMMRARPAERVWREVGRRDDRASFDDVVAGTDLEPLGTAWTSIKRPVAISLLELLLHRDLAYGAQLMPEQRARRLAEWFVDSFGPSGCRYGTNRPLVGGRLKPSWTPATSSTLDAGLVIIGPERVGVFWVADED
jgi:hypothetical protein